jgi:hypothetical protein
MSIIFQFQIEVRVRPTGSQLVCIKRKVDHCLQYPGQSTMESSLGTASIDCLSVSPSVGPNASEVSSFTVGQLVEVEPRTWPGINQPGGIGRITGVAAASVSVRYLVHRRHEKGIPLRFVKVHAMPKKRLRDRSMLLGRCQQCGSLRTDCGSCDLWAEQEVHHAASRKNDVYHSNPSRWSQAKNHRDQLESDDSDSDGDSSSLEEDIAEENRRFQRYQRRKKRTLRFLADASDETSQESRSPSSSGSSSNDDSPLRALVGQESQPMAKSSTMAGRKLRAVLQSNKGCKRAPLAVKDSTGDEEISVKIVPRRAFAVMEEDEKSFDSVSCPGTPDLTQRASPALFQQAGKRHSGVSSEDGDENEKERMNLVECIGGDQFIQPEGDASDLPHDIFDLTKFLTYAELAPFFDRTIDEIETVKLPYTRRLVDELERALDNFQSLSTGCREELLDQWYVEPCCLPFSFGKRF